MECQAKIDIEAEKTVVREANTNSYAVMQEQNLDKMKVPRGGNIRTIAYGFILFISLIWCSAILLAPYWVDKHTQTSIAIYLFFSHICHQQPQRSLFLLGRPWAVCARCASIYFGFLFGALIYPLLRDLKNRSFPAKWLLLVALTPTTLDFSLGVVHIWPTTVLLRIFTGLILGVILSFYIIPGVLALTDSLVNKIKPRMDTNKHKNKDNVCLFVLIRGEIGREKLWKKNPACGCQH